MPLRETTPRLTAFAAAAFRGNLLILRRTCRPRVADHSNHLRTEFDLMTKPHRNLKKANHGARPANAKARRAKRRVVKT